MATRDTFKPFAGNLTRKDFGTLLPQTRADGVNEYLNAIVSKAAADSGYSKSSESAPRVHAFNTAIFTRYQAKELFNISGQGICRGERLGIACQSRGLDFGVVVSMGALASVWEVTH